MASYEANWRIANADAIPYPEDYSEWLTMLVELLNGNKAATEVTLEFTLRPESFSFRYTDNGEGCTIEEAQARLLQWAATEAVNDDSIYGHGTKKFLAKSGDYASLQFFIRSRPRGGSRHSLIEWTGPYKGLLTAQTIRDADTIPGFPATGFQIELPSVERGRLGRHAAAPVLRAAVQEIIRARKGQDVLDRIRFQVTVRELDAEGEVVRGPVEEEEGVPYDWADSSEDWRSFFEILRSDTRVQQRFVRSEDLVPGRVALDFYSFKVPQPTHDRQFHKDLKKLFPTYGNFSGGAAARIHCFNNGTMIEACPFQRIYNRATHSSMYHIVEFAFFRTVGGEENHRALPPPATTKVQYRYEKPVWQDFIRKVLAYHEEAEGGAAPAAPAPSPAAPAPTPSPARGPGRPRLAIKPRKAPAAAPAPAAAGGTSVLAALQGGEGVGSASPSSSPPPAPTPPIAFVREPPPMFGNNLYLNQRKAALEAAGKRVRKYDTPSWINFTDVLITEGPTPGTVQLETIRERQKGDMKDDVAKAHTVLAHYANQHRLTPAQVTLQFKFAVKRATGVKRLSEVGEIRRDMLEMAYPYINSIQFSLVEEA